MRAEGCSALFSGWEVQKPQVFVLRGRERTRSCPDMGGRHFAFVTESKGSNSAWRQESAQSSPLRERAARTETEESHQNPAPEVAPGAGG